MNLGGGGVRRGGGGRGAVRDDETGGTGVEA